MVIMNLPKSDRVVQRFKRHFPNATFYGSTSLGSGRKSYQISLYEYNDNRDFFKRFKITKSRTQY